MKRGRGRLRVAWGYVGFFCIIALTVTVAMLIYGSISNRDNRVVAAVMIVVILALSALCTLVDIFRRKFTVDRPVAKILDATERIARGDFTVRLDITHTLKQYDEFDNIMENLNKMAAELSRNEVLKTEFISNVSHEIKTPLSVIQNYASALSNEKLSPDERKKYIATLMDATRRLTDLVVNILRLNKLENQRIRPEKVEIRLDEMLAQTVFAMEDAIERKNLNVSCDIDELTVTSSPSHLEIVWNNLMSNAVKFTPDGGEIRVSLKADGRNAVVKFSDTGCGISPETGAHIFEKFYQGDTSHASEGNGLGLALVKRVIDGLGGEISVESELGKGSTFTVVLKGTVNEEK